MPASFDPISAQLDAASETYRVARGDPARKYLFDVVCPAFGRMGRFSKISGIKEDIEVVEKRDGTQPFRTKKLVGQFKGGVLTLEKGVIAEVNALTKWFDSVKGFVGNNGQGYRTSVAIVVGSPVGNRVTGESGVVVAREIVLSGAWPSSYALGDLDAKSSDVAVETLTIQFESLDFRDKFINSDVNRFLSEEFSGHPTSF